MRLGLPTVLLLVLVLGLSVVPSTSAACVVNHQGTIRVPTGTTVPPSFSSPTMHGFTVYFHSGVVGGQTFELSPVSSCGGGVCPDFNLIFQKHGSGIFADQVGPTFNANGPESGTIPIGAQWALIWMRIGPDSPNGDTDPLFAMFNFGRIC